MARQISEKLTGHQGGIVVITKFSCRSWADLIWVVLKHKRLETDVRMASDGLIGAGSIVQWRERRMFSVSLWRDATAIYSMGEVPTHVAAVASGTASRTEVVAGLFPYMGHWANLLFGASVERDSPLT